MALVAWFSRGLLRYTGGKTFTGRLFGSREELRFVMQESAPNLTTEEKAMINRVLDLDNLRVRHVTIPMAAAATVPASAPMSQVLALCRERNLNRIPVLDTKTGQAAGVINLEWVLYSGKLDRAKPARDYMEPAVFPARGTAPGRGPAPDAGDRLPPGRLSSAPTTARPD